MSDKPTKSEKNSKNSIERLVVWHIPNGEVPDGVMLVEVDTNEGSDIALVYIDDDDCNTLLEPEHGDVWTLWTWADVSRYAMLDDILQERQP